MTAQQPPTQTNDAGIPVKSDQHSLTVGAGGPILLQDSYLIEQMANFSRERIAERQPHAKGSGAFGRFEVTADLSAYTKAAVFQPAGTTQLVARFSAVAGERGSTDLCRDLRGFALKFCTPEGNYDLVGNNTPVFFIKDPIHFQNFIRSQKRRTDNNLRDNDLQWNSWTLLPQTAHQVVWLMGDRGLPRTWRHMNGYSSHTYMWIDKAGQCSWVKYHFRTDQGIQFFTDAEAAERIWNDHDYHTRDLFEAIERGPSELDDVRADHAVRRRTRLPLQPFRPDQGLAALRLSPHRVRPADTGSQPDRQLHRDRAARVRAEQPRSRNRAVSGPDASRPHPRLRRCPSSPARRELQADSRERFCRPGARLQQGRRDADREHLGPEVLPQLPGRPTGRQRTSRRTELVRRGSDRPDGPRGLWMTISVRRVSWCVT
jgi:hypothetical protein